MRAYFWTNFMLSSIQHGIQAQHCTAEMFVDFVGMEGFEKEEEVLFDWARNHKTTIIKNGGGTKDLDNIILKFAESENYPWTYF